MNTTIKLCTVLAALSIGTAAPAFAQTSQDAPSANPTETRDVTTLRQLRADCPPGTIRQTMGGDCVAEADWDANMWWGEYMAGNTGAVTTDPLADNTTNPTETGDTDTTRQQIQN